MTLLTYQVFKTIADVGRFHKAADILGLTPSAISHAISSMENELGFSVLTRSKAGVNLTNYGEQLLPYVNAVLNLSLIHIYSILIVFDNCCCLPCAYFIILCIYQWRWTIFYGQFCSVFYRQ